MAKAQYFNRKPDDGLMHPAEVNAARLLSKQVAASRQRTPVGNRKSTTRPLAVPGAPAVASTITLSTSNPVAETAGATATPGVTGLAADAGHVHAAAIGTPVAIGNANAAGASGNFADAAHVHALGGTVGGDLSGTVPNPTVAAIHETSGPTQLTIGTITDGQFLKRVGSTLVSAAAPAGGINPTDYISGLLLSFSTTTAVIVGTGSAYSLNGAALITVTSPITFSYPSTALTDIVIDGSNNKILSSVAHTFVAADVGMDINMTSGTGFTVQHNTVVSVAGGKATMNLACGTVGSTSGHGTLQLLASTIYYVSLASSSTVSVSSTAPSSYQGTAWQDASTNRYVGAFLTNSSNQVVRWNRIGNQVFYNANTNGSPYQVLTTGSSTSAASVSCSGVVPATSRRALVKVHPSGSIGANGQDIGFGTSDWVPTVASFIPAGNPTFSWAPSGATNAEQTAPLDLNSSQAFQYILTRASSTTMSIYVLAYWEDR